jgi:hypothetical protein
MRCIICLKVIEELNLHLPEDNDIPLHQRNWDDASVDVIYPGYGSKHDLDKLRIAICDDCISKGINNGSIEKIGTYDYFTGK